MWAEAVGTVASSQHGLSAYFGEKVLHIFKNMFTPMNDKIRIKMSCLEILSQKKF
jgi:hypothetical protein